MRRRAFRTAGTLLLLACMALMLPGCGLLGEPEPEERSGDTEPAATTATPKPAPTVVSKEDLLRFEAGDPRRTVLDFLQAVQLRSWFDAYNRIAAPELRSQISFRRFIEVAGQQYPRLSLPFKIQQVDRRPGAAIVVLEVTNPADGARAFDSYQLVRRGGRWQLVFSTWVTGGDLALRREDDGEAQSESP